MRGALHSYAGREPPSRMRDTNTHHRGVIPWEWMDARGRDGAISGLRLDPTEQARIDERLDRIRRLESLKHPDTALYIHPLDHELKKLKIRGKVALRPILVLGPFDKDHEVTLLFMTVERNRKMTPPRKVATQTARKRLKEVLDDPSRRKKL